MGNKTLRDYESSEPENLYNSVNSDKNLVNGANPQPIVNSSNSERSSKRNGDGRPNINPALRHDAFKLDHGTNGARITRGWLEWYVTRIVFEKKYIYNSSGLLVDEVNSLASQEPIDGVKIMQMAEAAAYEDSDWLQLNWYGDVWAVVELSEETGEPVSLNIEGPAEPVMRPIPRLDSDLSREASDSGDLGTCGYAVKIGTVPENDKVVQMHIGNLYWFVSFIPEATAIPSSDGSDDSSDGSDDSDGGGSDSDESGDSDGSDDTECCPIISVQSVAMVNSDCFASNLPQTVLVLVTATITGNPCNCRNAFVEISFAGQKQYFNLGFAGQGTVTGFFQIMGTPCTTYGGTVCWRTSVNTAGDNCSSRVCCEDYTVRTPSICDSGCSSDESDSDGSDDSGSDGSDDSGSDGSDESGSDGSDDKTCIVPSLYSTTGYTALRCVESPEVWFVDIMRGIQMDVRQVQIPIDPQFIEVCAANSLVVTTVQADKPVVIGARIIKNDKGFSCVELTKPWLCGKISVVVTLQGIRSGFRNRFPEKTLMEYGKNKHFWEQL